MPKTIARRSRKFSTFYNKEKKGNGHPWFATQRQLNSHGSRGSRAVLVLSWQSTATAQPKTCAAQLRQRNTSVLSTAPAPRGASGAQGRLPGTRTAQDPAASPRPTGSIWFMLLKANMESRNRHGPTASTGGFGYSRLGTVYRDKDLPLPPHSQVPHTDPLSRQQRRRGGRHRPQPLHQRPWAGTSAGGGATAERGRAPAFAARGQAGPPPRRPGPGAACRPQRAAGNAAAGQQGALPRRHQCAGTVTAGGPEPEGAGGRQRRRVVPVGGREAPAVRGPARRSPSSGGAWRRRPAARDRARWRVRVQPRPGRTRSSRPLSAPPCPPGSS